MLPSNLINQLGTTLSNESSIKKKEKMTGSKIMISAKVDKTLKDHWFAMCEEHGLSFSTGIIVAFDVLEECMKKGIVELKPYGAVFK